MNDTDMLATGIPAIEARLTEAFLAHARETPLLLQQWLEAAPDSPRAHATKALMLALLARKELVPVAQEVSATAISLAVAGGAEMAYAEAASMAAHGAWWAATDKLEQVIATEPDNTLAAKMSHALRFMLGDRAGMLRSIERVLDRLSAMHAHRGFMLGCHAFSLEESGEYGRAEAVGIEAVEREGRDAWGLHAVSHVHEMMGRTADGIRWIEAREARIGHCNNFGGHLFWHLALFKLEAGAIGDVFDLYDRRIRHEPTDDFRDIANGASLLMRLELDGHDVGNRWEELADKAEARIDDRSLVFADLHYILALLGAGRRKPAAMLARSLALEPARNAVQNLLADRAGRSCAEGLVAYASGQTGRALELLLEGRNQRLLVGGSNAQRDIFEQITIEAALRSGNDEVARRLLTERLQGRNGHNRFAGERLQKLMSSKVRANGPLGLVASLAFSRPAH
ncbi:MAG TPA: tetratricopeptide repeat protein [Rhabdaerophilum sp.]|nr:tetratricopeptide repeat protein [Rhabdaerophilum sp.]